MAVGRAERRRERTPQVAARFAEEDVERALDLLELTELAWHDCYDELTPSREVVEDMLIVSRGSLAGLIDAARLAIVDRRDLRLAATEMSRPE